MRIINNYLYINHSDNSDYTYTIHNYLFWLFSLKILLWLRKMREYSMRTHLQTQNLYEYQSSICSNIVENANTSGKTFQQFKTSFG